MLESAWGRMLGVMGRSTLSVMGRRRQVAGKESRKVTIAIGESLRPLEEKE